MAQAVGYLARRSFPRRPTLSRIPFGLVVPTTTANPVNEERSGGARSLDFNWISASGSLDFHHTIGVSQLRATVDTRIHYSSTRKMAARTSPRIRWTSCGSRTSAGGYSTTHAAIQFTES
jgi:hypothetical protein